MRFVGINPYDTAATMERFAADRGVGYECCAIRTSPSPTARVVAYPVTLFVNGDGRIVARTGPIDEDELRHTSPSSSGFRREPRPLLPAWAGRRRQPVRIRPAADVPDVLPRDRGRARRPGAASVQRALTVAAAVSSGFMLVFVVAGVISNFFTSWLDRNAKYATAAIGVGLIVLGAAMLFGYRLPFSTPKVSGAGRDRTVRSMFVYGLAYAVASLELHDRAVRGHRLRRPGLVRRGSRNVVAFGLGMALIVTALTVAWPSPTRPCSAGCAPPGATSTSRGGLRPHLGGISPQVLLGRRPQRGHGRRDRGRRAAPELDSLHVNDNWQVVALVLAAVVVAAVVYVGLRRGADDTVEYLRPCVTPPPTLSSSPSTRPPR